MKRAYDFVYEEFMHALKLADALNEADQAELQHQVADLCQSRSTDALLRLHVVLIEPMDAHPAVDKPGFSQDLV